MAVCLFPTLRRSQTMLMVMICLMMVVVLVEVYILTRVGGLVVAAIIHQMMPRARPVLKLDLKLDTRTHPQGTKGVFVFNLISGCTFNG